MKHPSKHRAADTHSAKLHAQAVDIHGVLKRRGMLVPQFVQHACSNFAFGGFVAQRLGTASPAPMTLLRGGGTLPPPPDFGTHAV